MKKYIFLFLFFLSFFFVEQGKSQNSLLWEISGNGLKESSYLFGTIHLIDAKDFFFFQQWKKRLQSCKYLVLETDINIGFFKELSIIKQIKLPKDSILSDYMSPQELSSYESYMLDSLRVSPSVYRMTLIYKPFFTYSFILNDLIAGKKMFYEKYLSTLAKKEKIKILKLETIDFQMNLVSSIPIKKQIDMFLFDYGKEKQENIVDEFYKLVESYKKQDLNEIAARDNNAEEKAFNENFIYKRNRKWITKINEFIEKKPTFVAVGAGHLLGENGLIKLLENEGYTLTPVYGN